MFNKAYATVMGMATLVCLAGFASNPYMPKSPGWIFLTVVVLGTMAGLPLTMEKR